MNFARDVVEAADPQRLALVERSRAGERREWSFGEVARSAGTVARHFDEMGIRRGDVVLTLIGNQPEWVLTMVACFRQGYVVLPCTEQLRAKDLRQRLEVARPALVVCDERNDATLREAGWTGMIVRGP
jgi:acetyl-CoA synthetase